MYLTLSETILFFPFLTLCFCSPEYQYPSVPTTALYSRDSDALCPNPAAPIWASVFLFTPWIHVSKPNYTLFCNAGIKQPVSLLPSSQILTASFDKVVPH